MKRITVCMIIMMLAASSSASFAYQKDWSYNYGTTADIFNDLIQTNDGG